MGKTSAVVLRDEEREVGPPPLPLTSNMDDQWRNQIDRPPPLPAEDYPSFDAPPPPPPGGQEPEGGADAMDSEDDQAPPPPPGRVDASVQVWT